jgi:hypothetical protein
LSGFFFATKAQGHKDSQGVNKIHKYHLLLEHKGIFAKQKIAFAKIYFQNLVIHTNYILRKSAKSAGDLSSLVSRKAAKV